MAKSSNIRVRALSTALRGQRVGGVDGTRVYYCDPSTGLLHQLANGIKSEAPGVHPADAARYRRFADFEVEKRPPPPPKRTGSTAPGGSGDSDPDTPEPDLPGASAGGEGPDWLPASDDELTMTQWLKLAWDHGVRLTKAEKQTRPKAELVKVIRAKAAEAAKG